MSSADFQRQVEATQRDIERLQRELSHVSEDEARKSEYIARLTQRLVTEKDLAVVAQKQSEIRSTQQTIATLQKKRADINRKLADKTAELHRRQKSLFQEQAREQQFNLTRLRRQYEIRRDEARHVIADVATNSPTSQKTYDAFISHAREDKDELVKPLAEQLVSAGFSVWYDDFQLRVGDSLRQSIDRGLSQSRFGIVVLSPAFFAKNWPQYELNGLVARELDGHKVILPLWHKVTKNEVLSYSPSLADKLALTTATYTVEEIVAELAAVLRETPAAG